MYNVNNNGPSMDPWGTPMGIVGTMNKFGSELVLQLADVAVN